MKGLITNLGSLTIVLAIILVCSTTFLITLAEQLPPSDIELAMEMK